MSDIGRLGDAAAPYLLSVLRIIVGLLFLQHGMAKLIGFPHVATFDTLQPFSWPGGIAGIIEIIGSPLIILGLFTRPVAIILSGEMAFAYFMVHASRGFIPLLNGGEAAIYFCFTFLYIAAAGGGAWSLDRMR